MLCDGMDWLIKEVNPCKADIKDGYFTCVRCPDPREGNGCCGGCKHFKDGCTVKSLFCKMWLCREALAAMSDEDMKYWAEDVQNAEKARLQAEIPMLFRSSKEETFNDSCEYDPPLNACPILEKPGWYLDQVYLMDDKLKGQLVGIIDCLADFQTLYSSHVQESSFERGQQSQG